MLLWEEQRRQRRARHRRTRHLHEHHVPAISSRRQVRLLFQSLHINVKLCLSVRGVIGPKLKCVSVLKGTPEYSFHGLHSIL
jgi:hypothetical protein